MRTSTPTALAVLTGLRPGELLGLRVGDHGRQTGCIIARAINTARTRRHSGKNENAIRTVVLHPLAAERDSMPSSGSARWKRSDRFDE